MQVFSQTLGALPTSCSFSSIKGKWQAQISSQKQPTPNSPNNSILATAAPLVSTAPMQAEAAPATSWPPNNLLATPASRAPSLGPTPKIKSSSSFCQTAFTQVKTTGNSATSTSEPTYSMWCMRLWRGGVDSFYLSTNFFTHFHANSENLLNELC